MIINDSILEFIKDTEEEFITNVFEGGDEEIKNFYDTLSFLDKDTVKDKKTILNSFNEIKMNNLNHYNDSYEKILRQVSLTILDRNWHNHIQELTNIRMSVSLSGYGGKDPLNEFRKASFSAFNSLVYEIQKQMVLILNNIRISEGKNNEINSEKEETIIRKIGRNDLCPCGSGKKYKYCHGNVSLG